MHRATLFITNLDNIKDKNIKMHHKLMAATFWNFALKIAEKFFIYSDEASEYAKGILFIALHQGIDSVLEHIHTDFITHKIPYDDDEIYTLFIESYEKSNDDSSKKENIDFYN